MWKISPLHQYYYATKAGRLTGKLVALALQFEVKRVSRGQRRNAA